MSRLSSNLTNCPGPGISSGRRRVHRREILRLTLGGFATLSLPGLLRLRAANPSQQQAQRTAIILVWLRGGPSHLETFDPKPDAPSEMRGPYKPIRTNVPGIDICELLPRLACIADKYALLRSIAHTGGGHPAGSLQMLSGDPDPQDKLTPRYPDWMTVAHYLRAGGRHKIPNYVAINPVDRYDSFTIAGSTYLGAGYEGFKVYGDPSRPQFEVPNIGLKDEAQRRKLAERVGLRRSFDQWRREIDQSGMMAAIDHYEGQAVNLLLNADAKEAFDLNQEPDRVRDRYGRHAWGQQCLMARRFVEAGVEIVTTEFDGPQCGRVENWDDHAVNQHIFDAMKFRLPSLDQAVSALIEDIYARGLDQRVLVVVGGEFGRTPTITHVASSGGGVASGAIGTVQPGRDHWPRAGSMLFAGGGIRTGQVIGLTDARGWDPKERRVGPEDFLATLYQHLGIDFRNTTIRDFTGRPTPIIRDGEPITELSPSAVPTKKG